jgi:hypothetical protein
MDRTVQQWQIPEGTDVVGADGDKVGKVVAAQESYIVVEKGFFFPTDYYVPTNAIANYDGDKVYLSVTKDDALNQNWDQPVIDSSAHDTATGPSGVTSTAASPAPMQGDRLAGVTPTGIGDDDREGEAFHIPPYEEQPTTRS